MRPLFLSALCWLVAALPSTGDPATRERLLRHFGGWYSYYPGSRVSVRETAEIVLPGFDVYRVARHSESERHKESNVAVVDLSREEVFVGRVFHDSARGAEKRAFDPDVDRTDIEKSLTDAFGLTATVTLGEARGALRGIRISLQQLSEAWVRLPGFVSQDGASILLGEFQSLRDGPEAFRKRLLSETPGVRLGTGPLRVAEFLDFQCERCRKRAPEIKKFVSEIGGSIEIRFFPLVKVHPWAFAAAESAAALAALSPELYESYERALFARAESMDPEAARQLAADVAEAAGRAKDFRGEITSGRARERVLSDLRLGTRLGITGTPYFLHEGTLVSAEPDLLESLLRERQPAAR